MEWLIDRASELGLTCLPLPGPALASAGADYLKHLRELGESRNIEFESGPWTEPEQTAELVENGRRWAEALKAMGGEILMAVPGGRRESPPYTREEFQVMADAMNETGRQAQAVGIVAAMHPHWGTVAETQEEIELLLNLLDPSVVGFAPDSGQIAKGGADPVALFRDYADRIRHVHLKDLSPEWGEMQGAGVPL